MMVASIFCYMLTTATCIVHFEKLIIGQGICKIKQLGCLHFNFSEFVKLFSYCHHLFECYIIGKPTQAKNSACTHWSFIVGRVVGNQTRTRFTGSVAGGQFHRSNNLVRTRFLLLWISDAVAINVQLYVDMYSEYRIRVLFRGKYVP